MNFIEFGCYEVPV